MNKNRCFFNNGPNCISVSHIFLLSIAFIFLLNFVHSTCTDDDGVCGFGCSAIEDSDCFGKCGNGICDPNEDKCSCQIDCGSCEGSKKPFYEMRCTGTGCIEISLSGNCGNGICEGDENKDCRRDCADVPNCGNGVCDADENTCSCPGDCGSCGVDCPLGMERACAGNCVCVFARNLCGNGVCEGGENFANCKKDCLPRGISIECSQPSGEYLCNDRMKIVCKVNGDGAAGTGMEVWAEGFFGNVTLFDDSFHSDDKERDGIYGNEIIIKNFTKGSDYEIKVHAQRLISKGSGSVTASVTAKLKMELSCSTPVNLGESINCTARVFRKENELFLNGTWFLKEPGGASFSGDTNKNFTFRTSFLEKAGTWKAGMRFEDELGNIGQEEKDVEVSEYVEKRADIEIVYPKILSFKRAEKTNILFSITYEGKDLSNISGFFVDGVGRRIKIIRMGDLYGNELFMDYSFPEKWEMYVYATGETGGAKKYADKKINIEILPIDLSAKIIDEKLNDKFFLKFNVIYEKQCAKIEKINVSVTCSGDSRDYYDMSGSAKRTGECDYEIRENLTGNYTYCEAEILGKDSFGNVLRIREKIVRERNDTALIMGFGIAALLFAAVVYAYSSYKRRKEIMVRIEELEKMKVQYEKMYYEQGSLSRDAFMKKDAEISARLKELHMIAGKNGPAEEEKSKISKAGIPSFLQIFQLSSLNRLFSRISSLPQTIRMESKREIPAHEIAVHSKPEETTIFHFKEEKKVEAKKEVKEILSDSVNMQPIQPVQKIPSSAAKSATLQYPSKEEIRDELKLKIDKKEKRDGVPFESKFGGIPQPPIQPTANKETASIREVEKIFSINAKEYPHAEKIPEERSTLPQLAPKPPSIPVSYVTKQDVLQRKEGIDKVDFEIQKTQESWHEDMGVPSETKMPPPPSAPSAPIKEKSYVPIPKKETIMEIPKEALPIEKKGEIGKIIPEEKHKLSPFFASIAKIPEFPEESNAREEAKPYAKEEVKAIPSLEVKQNVKEKEEKAIPPTPSPALHSEKPAEKEEDIHEKLRKIRIMLGEKDEGK